MDAGETRSVDVSSESAAYATYDIGGGRQLAVARSRE